MARQAAVGRGACAVQELLPGHQRGRGVVGDGPCAFKGSGGGKSPGCSCQHSVSAVSAQCQHVSSCQHRESPMEQKPGSSGIKDSPSRDKLAKPSHSEATASCGSTLHLLLVSVACHATHRIQRYSGLGQHAFGAPVHRRGDVPVRLCERPRKSEAPVPRVPAQMRRREERRAPNETGCVGVWGAWMLAWAGTGCSIEPVTKTGRELLSRWAFRARSLHEALNLKPTPNSCAPVRPLGIPAPRDLPRSRLASSAESASRLQEQSPRAYLGGTAGCHRG